MSKPQTPDAIAAWAEGKAAPEPPAEGPAYRRMTDGERLTILQLHEKGWTQTAIAQHLSRAVSSVHEVIQTYAPTKQLATRKLAAAAVRMAENIIENGGPKEHVRVLEGLDVLHPKQQHQTLNIQINGLVLHGMGIEGDEESETDGPIVEAETLSPPDSGDLHRLSADS